MDSNDELLPVAPATSSDPPPLVGRARAHARAEAWKQKQRDKVDAERAEFISKRSFDWDISVEEEQAFQQRLEDLRKARLEEDIRNSHDKKVEPTIEPDVEDFQSLELPAVTVPLAISIQDTFNCFRQRVGPSLDDWCPIESLYRFSSAQFLFFVDPKKYHFLNPVTEFENFDCIIRAIQLNTHFYNDDFEIVPVIKHLNPRCITLESIDYFRSLPIPEVEDLLPSLIDFDLNLLRATNRDGKGKPLPRFDVRDVVPRRRIFDPADYGIDELMADAHGVRKLLKFYLPSDTDFYRPKKLFEPLLPKAPYLAILNQLPIRELARRNVEGIITFAYPSNCRLTFPLEIRIIGNEGYIYLMRPSIEDSEVLTAMVRFGDLPSGVESAWDDFDSDDAAW